MAEYGPYPDFPYSGESYRCGATTTSWPAQDTPNNEVSQVTAGHHRWSQLTIDGHSWPLLTVPVQSVTTVPSLAQTRPGTRDDKYWERRR